METLRIFTTEGRFLKFRGILIACVQSAPIPTSKGEAWFELSAYEQESHRWVVAIGLSRSDSLRDEVFDYYSSDLLASVEDFLYDFEPARIFPDDFVTNSSLDNHGMLVTADHNYYAAVRKLVNEMEPHESDRLKTLNQASNPSSLQAAAEDTSVVNRIKRWLSI